MIPRNPFQRPAGPRAGERRGCLEQLWAAANSGIQRRRIPRLAQQFTQMRPSAAGHSPHNPSNGFVP